MVKPRRIADFKPTFTNLAQTSHYQVIFGGLPLGVRQHLNVRGVDYRFITETSGLLCNNAVLPGATLATSQLVGNFMGVTENMAHTKVFTKINLEFYVDSEYKSLESICVVYYQLENDTKHTFLHYPTQVFFHYYHSIP